MVTKGDHQVVGHTSGAAEPVNVDDRAVGNVSGGCFSAGPDLVGPRQCGDGKGHFAKIRRYGERCAGHRRHVVRGPSGGDFDEFQAGLGHPEYGYVSDNQREAARPIDRKGAVVVDSGCAGISRVGHQGDDALGSRGQIDSEAGCGEAAGLGGGPVDEVAVGAGLGGLDEGEGDVPTGQH